MQIQITRTSRRFHLPPDIAQAFIEAGLATEVPSERLAQPSGNKRLPFFVVNNNPTTGNARIVLHKLNGEVEFPGPNGGTLEQGLSAFASAGFPVPQNIVDDYVRLEAANRAENAARWDVAAQFGIQGG